MSGEQGPRMEENEYAWRSILAVVLIIGGLAIKERGEDTPAEVLAQPAVAQSFETNLYLPLIVNRYQPEWQLGEPIPDQIIGKSFIIYNEMPADGERVAINPLFGRRALDGLIEKWKPGWEIKTRVVDSRSKIPDDRDGNPGGVGVWMKTPAGNKLFFAENVEYDRVNQHLTYYFFPGEIFSSFGVVAMTPGSDRRSDVNFSSRVIEALIFENDDFLYGFPEYPPGAIEDLIHFDGRVDNGGINTAICEWQLLPGVVLDSPQNLP